MGMSRCGFLVSSAAVATMSKPMKAKKTSAAPVKMPLMPNGAGREAEVLQQRRRSTLAPLAACGAGRRDERRVVGGLDEEQPGHDHEQHDGDLDRRRRRS